MYLAQRSLTIGYLLASAPPGNRFDPASSGSRRLLNLRDKGSLTDEVRVEVPTGHCQPPVSIFGARFQRFRASGSEKHRQDGCIRVADRVDADAADHRGDRSVGLGFHPGGPVLEAEMGKAG